jgi:uncharacterized membrane protein YhaH (DUF805 family)
VKRKYWWIFGAVQLMGVLAAFGGLYLAQDPILFGLSLIVLLPGTLVSYPFSTLGHAGPHWPLWTVYAIAVILNVLLFGMTSALVRRFRKSR